MGRAGPERARGTPGKRAGQMAREYGLARSEGEAGDWAVREGVARSGPGRWVGGVKGWAGVENGLRGEGERKEVGLMGFLGRTGERGGLRVGFWVLFWVFPFYFYLLSHFKSKSNKG